MTASRADLQIGELARRSGCSVDSIRFYERMDLLPKVPRSPGGHRLYGGEHLRRLRFIRRCRDLGLGLGEIGDLLRRLEKGACDCGSMRGLFAARAQAVRQRIGELRRLEADLRGLLAACGDAELTNCRVVEDMLAGEQEHEEGCPGVSEPV